MAYNLQELRRYIRQQKEIIIYYRDATKVEQSTTIQISRADITGDVLHDLQLRHASSNFQTLIWICSASLRHLHR